MTKALGVLIGIGGGLTTSPLPPHRTDGSRLRRVGGGRQRWEPRGRRGHPRPSKSLPGGAIASAGLRLMRHGPWADVTVGQARARLTPRRRRGRERGRSHGFHREPRPRRRLQASSSWTRDGAAAPPTEGDPPARSRRRSPPTRTRDAPRLRNVRRRTSAVHAFRAVALPRRRVGRRPGNVPPSTGRRPGRSPARWAAVTATGRRRAQTRVPRASPRGPAGAWPRSPLRCTLLPTVRAFSPRPHAYAARC
jgi:hypothetical protein